MSRKKNKKTAFRSSYTRMPCIIHYLTKSNVVRVRRRLWKVRWTFWRENNTKEKPLPKRPKTPIIKIRTPSTNQQNQSEVGWALMTCESLRGIGSEDRCWRQDWLITDPNARMATWNEGPSPCWFSLNEASELDTWLLELWLDTIESQLRRHSILARYILNWQEWSDVQISTWRH